MPSIKVRPSDVAVIDEEIEIRVDALLPCSPVTISADIVYYKVLYVGFGHFYSDSNGQVNLKTDCSIGGSYCGVQPMGMFTSMKHMPSKNTCPRLIVKVSVETPLTFNFNAWKGHLVEDQVHQLLIKTSVLGTKYPSTTFFTNRFLCTRPVQRTYLSKNVQRIPINITFDEETICGVLFQPKAAGQYPGVIDVFGAAGGNIEIRAALLAKHGYACLALAYFRHEQLKAQSYDDLQLSYFNKAIKWFAQHPSVKPGGVGMIGISLGAQIVLLCSINNSSIKAAICINSNSLMITEEMSQVPTYDYFLREDFKKEVEIENLYEIWKGEITSTANVVAKFNRPKLQYAHDNAILFLIGEHDIARQCMDDAMNQLIQSGKRKVFKKVIEGEGHIIDPPYMPMCTATAGVKSATELIVDDYEDLFYEAVRTWEGDRSKHGEGQVEAWKTVLAFLNEHLTHSKTSKL